MGGTEALIIASAVNGYMQSSQQAKQAKRTATRQYQEQAAAIERQKKADTKARLSALEQASATRRAQFAAGGINSKGGSSAAVLEGMADKTKEQLEDQAQYYDAQLRSAQGSFADAQAAQMQKKNAAKMDLLLSAGKVASM